MFGKKKKTKKNNLFYKLIWNAIIGILNNTSNQCPTNNNSTIENHKKYTLRVLFEKNRFFLMIIFHFILWVLFYLSLQCELQTLATPKYYNYDTYQLDFDSRFLNQSNSPTSSDDKNPTIEKKNVVDDAVKEKTSADYYFNSYSHFGMLFILCFFRKFWISLFL